MVKLVVDQCGPLQSNGSLTNTPVGGRSLAVAPKCLCTMTHQHCRQSPATSHEDSWDQPSAMLSPGISSNNGKEPWLGVMAGELHPQPGHCWSCWPMPGAWCHTVFSRLRALPVRWLGIGHQTIHIQTGWWLVLSQKYAAVLSAGTSLPDIPAAGSPAQTKKTQKPQGIYGSTWTKWVVKWFVL